MLVNIDDKYLHRIANVDDTVDAADVATAEFADMAKSITPGKDFDERTEFFDAADRTVVDLADLDSRGTGFHRTHSLFRCFLARAGNQNSSVVINFNDSTSGFLNAADILASGTDQGTDLVWSNLCAKQTRCSGRNFAARP